MINLDHSEHPVIAVHFHNNDLFELVVERRGLLFTPGDCVAIYTDVEKSRPYSIASGSNENELCFLIRAMDGGEVSPWLMHRKAGDILRITPPFGWFRPGQEIGDAPFVFLATGTGIAPFLSFTKTFSIAPAACLYGVRHESDAAGYAHLKNRCPTRLAVSRETTNHHHGRITDLLNELPENDDMHYYCCGLESMINEVTAWLSNHNIALSRIHREVFFHG